MVKVNITKQIGLILNICFILFMCILTLIMLVPGCVGDDDDNNDNNNNDNNNDDNDWSEDIVIEQGSRYTIWRDYLTDPDSLQYHKYGLYTNRLLTVVHPEVYLLGDYIFINNVDGRELQPLYGWDETFFFYLNNIDFTQYEIIKNADFYPPFVLLFPYLDRRCLAAKSTLMETRYGQYPFQQTRIKEIEKGILYFCKIRRLDSLAAVFLLYAEDESCYVWNNGTLYSMESDSPVEADLVHNENIVLIFDDHHVWYPLMERDDTELNPILSTLVDQFGSNQLPQLTLAEEYLLPHLKEKSQLRNQREITLASLFAGKSNYSYGVRKYDANWIEGMDNIWQNVMPFMKHEDLVSMLGWYTFGSIDAILTKHIILDSNVLSPNTYALASYLPDDYSSRDLAFLSDIYFLFGYYWGTVWELGFDTYNIDESLLCHGGACDIQALNICSVLNLKGIDNYFFIGYRGFRGYAHSLVYVPEFGTIFSNGYYLNVGSIFTGYTYPNAPFYMTHNGDWAAFILESYYGNIEPDVTADWLEFLYNQYYDEIFGNSRQNGDAVDVQLWDFLAALRSQQYHDSAIIVTLP